MRDEIRAIVAQHGRLAVDIGTLADDSDLYVNGLTSHASVNLMLALEDEFGVEFPESMLRKQTFQSVDSIAGVVERLQSAG